MGITMCVDSLEDGCQCGENQFTCLTNTTCINFQYVCDKVKDCPDESDEINCSNTFYY